MRDYRNDIQWFTDAMVEKLEENDYKGGWEKCENSYLIKRLLDEVGELIECVLNEKATQCTIIPEAADVANIAMMLADKSVPVIPD